MAERQTAEGKLVGSLREIMADAVTSFDRKDFGRAEEILRQVVAAEPGVASAWHLRGLIAQHNKDHVRASEYLAAAVSRAPDNGVYCRDLGISLVSRGHRREAIELLERAATLAPEDAAAHFHLGNALLMLSRPLDAVTHLAKVVEREPQSATAHNNLAVAFRASGNPAAAMAAAEKALRIAPGYSEALNNLALALCDCRRYPEAVDRFEAALSLDPVDPELLNNAGVALHADGRLADAEQRLRAALELRPGWGEAALNLGNLLRQQNRLEEAVRFYREALADDPMDVKPYANLGIAWITLNKPEEAIPVYEKALSLEPENADIRMSLGIAQLMRGDFAEGWKNYEFRWQAASFTSKKRTFITPLWNGVPQSGQRILVHAEQGFGDTVQFCRYLPELAAQDVAVIFECQEALYRLCETIDGVAKVIVRGAPLPDSDAHVPLLSLPRLFGTTLDTIPAATPYLTVPRSLAAAWSTRFTPGEFNVGLVWSGDPKRQDDVLRSCPKTALAPILAVDGARLFSLQVGDKPDGSMHEVTDLGSAFMDFADTAAAIASLDLVVTVDTAVAHLAGALGRPVWVMLGHHADWRYLMDREDSPWYPTMRLFRQDRREGWPGMARRVADALDECTQAGT